ncbi:MAG: hypothetical protein ACJAYF_003591 [Arenicella sp.]
MSIICIEGASGVGKSTVCDVLEKEHGYKKIPEVNYLFKRPPNPSATWYFEKQVERWNLAKELSRNDELVVLDGDPFQPLWYNWIFSNDEIQPLSDVIEFYFSAVEQGRIKFPDRYFILTAPESALRKRKEGDTERLRRNFESHLRLIRPQLDYFAAFNTSQPNAVSVLESGAVSTTVEQILASAISLNRDCSHLNLFKRQRNFVNNTRAD